MGYLPEVLVLRQKLILGKPFELNPMLMLLLLLLLFFFFFFLWLRGIE
jgi:hypothetical protein